MSVSKLDISEKLVEGYVKFPPSLKEQTITSLAIQLCHNDELKKGIFQRELSKPYVYWITWYGTIDDKLANACQNLPLPSGLKKLLVVRMRAIDMQLHDWPMQQDMFKLSPIFADSLLIPSDWAVVEMRLDEQKIAKRLVQDERIPLVQLFRMACFHCLESSILSLWSRISHEGREEILQREENKVVCQWFSHLSGELNKVIQTPDECTFWSHLLKIGVVEGSLSSVIQSWGRLNESMRQVDLMLAAMASVEKVYESQDTNCKESSSDIFCFLLTRMSKEQRMLFFQTAFQNTKYCVLVCFLRWPYLDLFLSIINELWDILPVLQYSILLSSLARRYSEAYPFVDERQDYSDYDYGYLIVDILEETPDHFKRYIFANNYRLSTDPIVKENLLYSMLKKAAEEIQHGEILKRIWEQVSFEERRSFSRSYYGELLWNGFRIRGNRELLHCLRTCLLEY